MQGFGSILPWRRSGCWSCRVDVPVAGVVRLLQAIEESPAGRREPDAASSSLQHLQLPGCPCFSCCFFCSGFPPLLPAGSLRRGAWWSRGSLPPGSREGARSPGAAGGSCTTAVLPGAAFVLVLKVNAVFSKVFSTSESCSLRPNMVVLKEKYF